MIIIGAGMTGLLAGALNPGSIIYEAGPERDSDHKAVFRCKSPRIGEMLGIPFKEVTVHKTIWMDGMEFEPSPRLAHGYSRKVTGTISARSIFNTKSCTRYIPPCDFIDQLKRRCEVKYDFKATCIEADKEPHISTMPLPNLLSMMRYPNTGLYWGHNPIYVSTFDIDHCDSYCTVYYPSELTSVYRASITGSKLIIESMEEIKSKELIEVVVSLGLPWSENSKKGVMNHKQKMGKITPIDEKIRRNFVSDMTIKHNIYSLGRFATWRPKVMLDDVLKDIFVIKRLIEEGNYGSIIKGAIT